MSEGPVWRRMEPGDVPAVHALSLVVHPFLPEREALYHDRMALFPDGCLVLDEGGAIAGYGLAFPARLGEPPPLDTLLGRLPEGADALYLADVAIAPGRRGRSLAEAGIRRLLALSVPFGASMLIAVYATAPFWQRFGFADETLHRMDERKLATYGEDARYMVRYDRARTD